MCNSCIHAPVCGKSKATGGQVGKCEHFHEEIQMPQKPERVVVHNDELWKKEIFRCRKCARDILVLEAIARPDRGFEKLKQEATSAFCRYCGQALEWGELVYYGLD